MPENNDRKALRRLERKYRRLDRQAKWDSVRPKLPYMLAAGVLLCVTALLLAIYFRRADTLPETGALLHVDVLDVGQGDAILLRTEGHAVLIDAGDTDKGVTVVQQLAACGVTALDCIINSHPHADHLGGIEAVLRAMPVHAIYMPDIPAELLPTAESYLRTLQAAEELHIPVHLPQCRETLPLGAASLTFLSVDNAQFDELNNCSLCCLVTCGVQRFLFTGDLEAEGEAAFLAAGLIPEVSFLKVGHHGSSSSSSEAFLAAAKPDAAAISCGAMNDYGHPSAAVLERLAAVGCTVWRTDLDGALHFETDGETLWLLRAPGRR